MTKVVFHLPYDFSNVEMDEFLAGTVDLATATTTQFTISEGAFDAVLHGSGFNPINFAGTVNEVDVLYKNRPLFTASKMNVALSEVWDNREDGGALLDIFFGGADTFKGSKGADVLASHTGDDVLSGGKGADALIGGLGADTMFGGAHEDTFVYLTAADSTKKVADLIMDLNDADDFINLQALNLESLDQITAVYNESKDRTAFIIDVNGEASMFIAAEGDHTGFSHFII
jgi:Ca2+-binding RTX toxin-like protein